MTETSTDLAIRDNQTTFDPKQIAALQQLGVQGASNADLALFFHHARRTGLDPFLHQIYMIGRRVYENDQWIIKQTIQTGIDGFRLVASRNDPHYSLSPVEYMRNDGQWVGAWAKTWGTPLAARVTLTKGNGAQFTSTLTFEEYAQTKKGGDLNSQWARMPAHMLEKCVEADVIRKAFPQDLSGLYTEDEMGDSETLTVTPRVTTTIQAPKLTITQTPPPRSAGGADTSTGQDNNTTRDVERPRRQRARAGESRVPVQPGVGVDGEVAPTPGGINEDTGEVVDAEIVEDVTPPTAADVEAAGLASRFQMTALHAMLGDLGLGGDGHHEIVANLVGHPVEHCNLLTDNEADYCIQQLRQQLNDSGAGPCTAEQRDQIGKELKRRGMGKDEALALYMTTTSREIQATVDLSRDEADQVLAAFRDIKDGGAQGAMFPEGDPS